LPTTLAALKAPLHDLAELAPARNDPVMLPKALVLLLGSLLQSPAPSPVRETWPSGTPRAEYEVSEERGATLRSGKYREWHENGTLAAEGTYSRGLRAGTWETWHANGAKASRGRYASDKRAGKWSFWHEDGLEDLDQTGQWQWAETRYENGELRACGYEREGVRHGAWTLNWPDGTPQFEGAYRNGLRRGEWIFQHRDGRPALWLLSGEYDGDRRVALLARERWDQVSKEREASARDRELVASAPADAKHERTVAPGDVERFPALLAEWQTLDAGDPHAMARAKTLNTLAATIAGGSSFGWPTGATERDAQLRREVFRSWASLWELVRNDRVFWCFELAAPNGDAASNPALALGTPHLEPERVPLPSLKGARDPYVLRPGRAGVAKLPAGTPPEVKACIDDALAWLVAHQERDGRWCAVTSTMCGAHAGDPCEMEGQLGQDVGLTALALLALMADGHTPRAGAYAPQVAQAVRWLTRVQDASGFLQTVFIENELRLVRHDAMIGHAIATLALCEAYALSGVAELAHAAERALAAMAIARNPYGAWRYDRTPAGNNDTFVTAWVVFAFVAADELELTFDRGCLGAGLSWMWEATAASTGRAGYDGAGASSTRYKGVNDHFSSDGIETLTAAAIGCRALLSGPSFRSEAGVDRSLELLRRLLPRGDERHRDFLYGFFGAGAANEIGGNLQHVWSKSLNPLLLGMQRKDGAQAGSWDPNDAWSYAGGRVYATAINALALQAPYRRAPRHAAGGAKAKAK
jgi:hypothetical protein